MTFLSVLSLFHTFTSKEKDVPLAAALVWVCMVPIWCDKMFPYGSFMSCGNKRLAVSNLILEEEPSRVSYFACTSHAP